MARSLVSAPTTPSCSDARCASSIPSINATRSSSISASCSRRRCRLTQRDPIGTMPMQWRLEILRTMMPSHLDRCADAVGLIERACVEPSSRSSARCCTTWRSRPSSCSVMRARCALDREAPNLVNARERQRLNRQRNVIRNDYASAWVRYATS